MKKAFLLLIFLSALGTAASAQSLRIYDRQWKLTELNGSPVGTSNAYLEFDRSQARFSGNAGCNRMFGGVTIRGRQITFSNVGTTRMACVDARVQRNEMTFLRELKNVDRFRQSENSLEMMVQRRVVMRFVALVKHKPEEPSATVQLEDKKWVLEAIGNSPVPKIGRTAFVVFDKDKASAGGNSSCNVFGGSYSATGGTIEIIEIMSTMMACVEDSRMDIERQFLDSLRTANRYEIENTKLMLYRNDRLLLTMIGATK
jgi:heat shock protein HslJ